MVDIQIIRDDPEKVKIGIKNKNYDPKLVDEVLALDEKRRKLIGEIEDLRAQRNDAAKNKDIEKGKQVKTKLQALEPDLKEAQEKYKEILWKIPNMPSEDTPVGKDETESKVIRKWGEPKRFNFKVKDHMELGKDL